MMLAPIREPLYDFPLVVMAPSDPGLEGEEDLGPCDGDGTSPPKRWDPQNAFSARSGVISRYNWGEEVSSDNQAPCLEGL